MGARWRRKCGRYLQEWLTPRNSERGLGSKIHERFAGLEGELPVPDRGSEPPRAAVFDHVIILDTNVISELTRQTPAPGGPLLARLTGGG